MFGAGQLMPSRADDQSWHCLHDKCTPMRARRLQCTNCSTITKMLTTCQKTCAFPFGNSKREQSSASSVRERKGRCYKSVAGASVNDLAKEIACPYGLFTWFCARRPKIFELFESYPSLVGGRVWEPKWPALEAMLLAWFKNIRSLRSLAQGTRYSRYAAREVQLLAGLGDTAPVDTRLQIVCVKFPWLPS